MNLKYSIKALVTHAFFFFFFLVLPTLVFERLPGESMFTVTRVIVQDTIANFILLCFFYINYYLLIPKYYFEKRYSTYVSLVILFLIITLPLPHFIGDFMGQDLQPKGSDLLPPNGQHFDEPPSSFPLHFSLDELKRHLYLFFTAVFFSFLLRTREHVSQLKEDKLNAEISSLKAQINPHFLFNTLNSIYSLSVKKDDRASEAIVNLASLMRYVIKDVNRDKILLGRELQYIDNYIELQKARLGNTASVKFKTIGSFGNKKITPLVLITYIENAFKYGVNPDVQDCVVDIQIEMSDTEITLDTFNKKVSNLNAAESTGIGMKNTSERLKYLYPQKHQLQIKEDETTYSIHLTIELS